MTKKSTFLEALEKATQADLDAINEDIAELEKQLEKRKSQRRMVEILLGVAKPRKKPASRAGRNGDGQADDDEPMHRPQSSQSSYEKRLRVAKLLLTGPRKVDDIIRSLGLPTQGFHSTLSCEWFDKTSDGSIHLTSAGRAAATGKPQMA